MTLKDLLEDIQFGATGNHTAELKQPAPEGGGFESFAQQIKPKKKKKRILSPLSLPII